MSFHTTIWREIVTISECLVVITAHKLWTRQRAIEKAAFSAHTGRGFRATWTESSPEERAPDDEWQTSAAPRLRLYVEESKSCERGMRQDHTLACQKKLMETEDTRQGSTDAGLLTWKELLHSGRASGKTVRETPNAI